MNLTDYQNRLTTGFIILSLLIHLLLLLIPESSLLTTAPKPEPLYVEVRPQPQRERELDLPVPPKIEKPRETPAKRLGPADQVVKKEAAPEGQDSEDRLPSPLFAPDQQPFALSQSPQLVQEEPLSPGATAAVATAGDRPVERGEQPQRSETPDLAKLTQISPTTLAKLESDWRQKYRENVAKGDTVWLDTEQDLLISFMRRFRDNIYGVWNYPAPAAERGQEGTCLLRITVNRRGDVENVELIESSGSPLLDNEAMRAVRLGATYGPLPQSYPNQLLHIMAFFQYNLNRVSYRRPVRIY